MDALFLCPPQESQLNGFEMTACVQQGYPLSPLLFAVSVAVFVRKF